MRKSLWTVLLSLLLCALFLLPGAAGGADGSGDWHFTDVFATSAPAATEDALRERLFCSSAILIEASTGQVLYEWNADTQMAPASITKVMTLLLLMEAIERGEVALDEMVSASEHACSMGGSQIWLEPGEQMSVQDLLKATAIQSANDASVALAERIGGSEDGFVVLMNEKAQTLGMTQTHFQNASGLDAEGHYTSARDIATMSRELLRHDQIREYTTIWMDTLRGGETELTNTNKLLKNYKGTTGLKTGTTDDAGSCLTASAMRDGMELIAVTMGSATSDQRFASAKALLDYGFGRWQILQPESIADQLTPVPVHGGVERMVDVVEAELPSVLVERSGAGELTSQLQLYPYLEAPVQAGQKAGEVEILVGGQPVASYEIVTAAAVEEMNFGKAFWLLLQSAVTF